MSRIGTQKVKETQKIVFKSRFLKIRPKNFLTCYARQKNISACISRKLGQKYDIVPSTVFFCYTIFLFFLFSILLDAFCIYASQRNSRKTLKKANQFYLKVNKFFIVLSFYCYLYSQSSEFSSSTLSLNASQNMGKLASS